MQVKSDSKIERSLDMLGVAGLALSVASCATPDPDVAQLSVDREAPVPGVELSLVTLPTPELTALDSLKLPDNVWVEPKTEIILDGRDEYTKVVETHSLSPEGVNQLFAEAIEFVGTGVMKSDLNNFLESRGAELGLWSTNARYQDDRVIYYPVRKTFYELSEKFGLKERPTLRGDVVVGDGYVSFEFKEDIRVYSQIIEDAARIIEHQIERGDFKDASAIEGLEMLSHEFAAHYKLTDFERQRLIGIVKGELDIGWSPIPTLGRPSVVMSHDVASEVYEILDRVEEQRDSI